MLDLFRPFSFITIQHPSRLPWLVNWILPIILTAATIAVILAVGPSLNLYGTLGLLDRLLTFTQTLAGFYIAALAAVSSFNSPHLDRLMPPPAPTMYIKYNGAMQLVQTTRRRFLTSMFAYLTAISFLFSLLAITTLVFAPFAASAWPKAVEVLRPLGAFCFLFVIFQMTLVTFWGLFYLGERMLTPD